MPDTQSVQIRELDQRDINAILARNLVGRLAFLRGEEIDVLPLHYVYAEGSIFGRTAAGGKLSAMNPNGTRVAFEVDEVQSMNCWRSVLVHGTFLLVSDDVGLEERLRAMGMVRRLDRHALREDDPAPHRTELFRIVIHDATGRALG